MSLSYDRSEKCDICGSYFLIQDHEGLLPIHECKVTMKDKLRFKVGEKGWLILQININGIWSDVDLHSLEKVEK
jgi:hypothetical protein